MDPLPQPVDIVQGRQAEVGYRLDLLQQRLNVVAAYYNLVRENVPITVDTTATGPIIEQAGKQRSRGIEVDVVGELSPRWRATVNYGLTDSEYLEFRSGNINLSGRQTAFAPRRTANVWTTYVLDNGFGVGLGGRFVGQRFTNFFNDVLIGSYTTWDSAVFYRRDQWDLSLNLNNILNKERYFVGALYNTQLYPGAPFNAVATLRVRLR